MRIAVPIFGSRISPRFDCTHEIVFVKANINGIVEKKIISVLKLSPCEKVLRLKALKVNVLICGGIDTTTLERLKTWGIAVKPWLTGDFETTLHKYLTAMDRQEIKVKEKFPCNILSSY